MHRTSRRVRALTSALIALLTVMAFAGFAPSRAAGPRTGHLLLFGARRSLFATTQGWSAYLHGPKHSSYSEAQTAIRPATVTHLVAKWQFLPGQDFLASPAVADGSVFIGSPGS